MSLLNRIPAPATHTIRQFLAAARLRDREAHRLLLAGDRLTAAYLSGYVAEMVLKAAYFRLIGWSRTAVIRRADLQNAQNRATHILGILWVGNLHDLDGWLALLIQERMHLGQPYDANYARALGRRVAGITANWREYLRYYPNLPYRGEVRTVVENAAWLLAQYRYL